MRDRDQRFFSRSVYKNYKDKLSVNSVDNLNLYLLFRSIDDKIGLDQSLYAAVNGIEQLSRPDFRRRFYTNNPQLCKTIVHRSGV